MMYLPQCVVLKSCFCCDWIQCRGIPVGFRRVGSAPKIAVYLVRGFFMLEKIWSDDLNAHRKLNHIGCFTHLLTSHCQSWNSPPPPILIKLMQIQHKWAPGAQLKCIGCGVQTLTLQQSLGLVSAFVGWWRSRAQRMILQLESRAKQI